jgi:hypothetical protein
VIASFFAEDKLKKRIEALVKFQRAVQNQLGSSRWMEAIAPFVAPLTAGEHPIAPFHWEVEFPEVFARDNPGFDAIVGNPPFAGKNTIIAGNSPSYLPWLQAMHEGAHGNSDLVAHFFRRAFGLLRRGGVFGLIATNTIGQGDTRASGLAPILSMGGAILRATRRRKWPGEAAVVVSVVHVVKAEARSPVLDERPVHRISAYLVEGNLDDSPAPLAANAGKAFQGSIVLGMGFTFDDVAAAKGEAESLATMRTLIEKYPRNAERIFPYVGGEEVNTDPRHAYHRYVIDFFDRPLRRESDLKLWGMMDEGERADCRTAGIVPEDYPDEVAEDWPDLIEIVRRRVKPERDTQKRDALRIRWWQYAEKRPGLRAAISKLQESVLVVSRVTEHLAIAKMPVGQIYADRLVIFPLESSGAFSVIQSRTHELWARFFSATMEDRLLYTPSDCFRTFPFPTEFETSSELEASGEAYRAFRAQLMIERNEGLTKTYNRFHARAEKSADITRLRALHSEMDRAVLGAYGWDDLAARSESAFIDQEADEGKAPKTRLEWPAELKDEVLSRLLALNADRAAAEKALGLLPIVEADQDADGEGVAQG